MTPPQTFIYWIEERERVRKAKEYLACKPWSQDPIFQTTYFCNVRREHDRVTRFVREFYSHHVNEPMFEYNMVLARLLNRPTSIQHVGYLAGHNPEKLVFKLQELINRGESVWGGAYLVSTNGVPVAKPVYIANRVLGATYKLLGATPHANPVRGAGTLRAAHKALQGVDGLGSFMAAQVIADLKNTEGHPLVEAADWWQFAAHGPGSLRGASWFIHGKERGITPASFPDALQFIRQHVDAKYQGPRFCNQDLQNCLCEFDKYMRIKTGTGRSKRNYPGV